MKTMNLNALSALAALGVFAAAGDAFAASVTGSAGATIATPIAISETTSMNFGTVTAGTGGTAVVSSAGARTVTGNVGELGGTIAAAAFSVTGEGTSAYSVTLPSTAVTLNGPSAATMTVDTFNHDAGASPALSGGSASFNVGATLNVGSGQTAGAYTGTYTVTVNYN